jgi:hypothetical protein
LTQALFFLFAPLSLGTKVMFDRYMPARGEFQPSSDPAARANGGKMRKKLLTDSVMAQIPRWLSEERMSPAEIAKKIGCTIGSLRVRCSQQGISLRRKYKTRRSFVGDDLYVAILETGTQLQKNHRSRARLKERATMMGISESELVTMLIETIEKDDLYNAILDDANAQAA